MRIRVVFIIVIAGLFLFKPVNLSAQNSGQEQGSKRVNYSDPTTWLLGYFKPDALLLEPHNTWYNSEYDSYTFDDEAFVELAAVSSDDITIKIVLGTWCPDSRRELPRFMKILQSWGFDEGKLTLLGVDSYKVGPVDGYADLNIERVPTFIIYKNKIEVGRIIEYPKASLERDMVDILKKTEN